MRACSSDHFEAALGAHHRVDFPALPGRTNHLPTGVLVPIVWSADPTVIATVRAARLREHASEVCFPGGRPDPEDLDLRATALREAREELGLEGARVIGELSSVPLYTSDYRLHPFVALVPEQALRVSEAEVAEVLRFSLRQELERESIESIAWSAGHLHGLSPLFFAGEHIMYGATAHAFYELLCIAAEVFAMVPPPLRAGRYDWSDVMRPKG